MEIDIVPYEGNLPVDRAYTVSIVIKSFKGRKDVPVHLFRSSWDPAEEDAYDWSKLIGDPIQPDLDISYASARRVLMESFTIAERDAVVEYIQKRYGDKVSRVESCALNLPVPLGLIALSELTEGKDIGFVHFDKTPGYDLAFPLKGFFDLSAAGPLVESA